MTLPAWVGYLFIAALAAFCGWRAWVWAKAASDWEDDFVPPPEVTPVPVYVRGGPAAGLRRFGRCWSLAFECIAQSGPWPRELLLARLGPGTRVEWRPVETWLVGGKLVGGQYVAGTIHVGLDLSSLCHELIHRCEALLENGGDLEHVTWQGRGLLAADNAYRAGLAKL